MVQSNSKPFRDEQPGYNREGREKSSTKGEKGKSKKKWEKNDPDDKTVRVARDIGEDDWVIADKRDESGSDYSSTNIQVTDTCTFTSPKESTDIQFEREIRKIRTVSNGTSAINTIAPKHKFAVRGGKSGESRKRCKQFNESEKESPIGWNSRRTWEDSEDEIDGELGFRAEVAPGESGISKTEKRILETEREITRTENEVFSTKKEIQYIQRKIIDLEGTGFDYDPAVGVKIRKFDALRPTKGNKYFGRPAYVKQWDSDEPIKNEGLAIGIPFFNEPSHELQQTLTSLHVSLKHLRQASKRWREKPIYVNIIQDGWHKAHPSMKKYLQVMFPCKVNGVDWWEYYEEFHDGFNNPNCETVFVFEKKYYEPVIINPQDCYEGKRKFLRVSLMVKINNRKKHNSHEWFLGHSGFAEAVKAEYLFLTDAFTLFNESCMYHLIKQIDGDKRISAVTGRQRLMTRRQQGTTESMFSVAYMLRMVQLYDFEMSNAVYNGAFSLGGFLPVVPGPCGLYRASDMLQDKPRDWYFGIVNEEPDKTGLVLGNLRIAEDRILSTSAAWKTSGQKKMAFNPLALFYFEAETELKMFILQRRRWINGSVAGYIYFLFTKFQNFRDWDAGVFRKVYIWILLFCQFLIYMMVGIAPGISLKILYFGVIYFLDWYGINFLGKEGEVLFGMGLWLIYVAHVFIHHRNKFNYVIMFLLFFMSMATTVISIASLVHYVLVDQRNTPLVDLLIYQGGVILLFGVIVFFLPFILAGMLSGRLHSVAYMVKSFLPYFLLTHMMIAWFGSYSYARIWDLSWGNRPSSELVEVSADQRKYMVSKFKERSVLFIFVLIFFNAIVFLLPIQGIFILMTTFYVIASYQMIFSFIFCLTKIFYKTKYACTKCIVGIKKRSRLFRPGIYSKMDLV
jgi:cellulose synthase/poly-beta-1,6-N-acetylglucosamine synthase-like glycosyltransferase